MRRNYTKRAVKSAVLQRLTNDAIKRKERVDLYEEMKAVSKLKEEEEIRKMVKRPKTKTTFEQFYENQK